MAVLGIERLIFGVDDVEACARFWSDFGLAPLSAATDARLFEVASGSKVEVRRRDDASLPPSPVDKSTMRETIWGVDSEQSLEQLVAGLRTDRDVRRDADGSAHFIADDGLALGLRVWQKRVVFSAPDAVNAPGNIQRLNQQRKWRLRALPKTINHVVYFSGDYAASIRFYLQRLGFKLTDHLRGAGAFARADGTLEHHSVFFFSNQLPMTLGKRGYIHSAFGVEDIDELMAGMNHMERSGWIKDTTKMGGLSRHRASSAVYCYVPCPAGGEAEYHADTDYLDDQWVPRVWNWKFGAMMWSHHLPVYYREEPIPWDVQLDPGGVSLGGGK